MCWCIATPFSWYFHLLHSKFFDICLLASQHFGSLNIASLYPSYRTFPLFMVSNDHMKFQNHFSTLTIALWFYDPHLPRSHHLDEWLILNRKMATLWYFLTIIQFSFLLKILLKLDSIIFPFYSILDLFVSKASLYLLYIGIISCL